MERLVLLTIPFLGTYAGSHGTSKNWRRIGIPIAISIYGLMSVGFWGLLGLLTTIPLRMGYGIPSSTDEGSRFGKFFSKFTKNERILDILVRGTIGIIFSLTLIYFPIIIGFWDDYLFGSIVIVGGYVLFGALIGNEGKIEHKKYQFLLEDVYIYTCVAIGTSIIGGT